jgi:hypothetical protein
LTALCACPGSGADSSVARDSRRDSSTARPDAPIAAVDTGPRYGDSTTFDPDGYYVPLGREGALERLEHIELETVEYSYDGSDHLDRPKLLTPSATLVFRSGTDSSSTARCDDVRFNRDSLNIGCSNTPIGDLRFRLRLLDPRGRYSRLPDYDEQTREIATGEVSVRSAAGVSSVQRASFYYTGGH